MGKKSQPKAPDPKDTASAQTATNVGTAIANSYMGNVNQVTPDGALNYSYSSTKWTDPLSGKTYDIPIATATQTLSEAQQAIKAQGDATDLNLGKLANTQSGRLNGLLAEPMSLTGAPSAGSAASLTAPNYTQFGSGPALQSSVGNTGEITKTYGTDFGANVKEVQDALMARAQPGLDQNRAALEQKLANQGLQPGSAAYDRAIDAAGRQENDARYGAILSAGQEQTRLANLEAQKAGFENAAQQQEYGQAYQNTGLANSTAQQQFQNENTAIGANNALQDQNFNAQQAKINAQNAERSNYLNEQYALRNQNINEVLGVASGSQVNNPTFVSTQGQSIPTVDYAGLVQQKYQADMAAYSQNQAGIGQFLGGLAGLFSKSDERIKKNVKKVGTLKGHGLYEYDFKGKHDDGKKHIGVLAQKVERKRPDAVKTIGGIKHVNYGALFEAVK
ncbi:tail fiber domain-containing protein [Agrobacterium rubi]|uniref:Tail fiber domain-containing protein n=1 Tax=Agrobacterium rubi TaxID=28099 RepID=A0ABX2J2R6_9HYPH|nr:tail fiber domain-containing protein [Agrobacterium rubi]NTF35566.1 tail fiber domain-containing protein [Agrobacterium rubi]